jgi:hypothetical protein
MIFSLIILFLFALFPSEISVSRIVRINRPGADVMKKIADLRQWTSWNDFLYDANNRARVSYARGEEDSTQIFRPYVTVNLLKVIQDTVITTWKQGDKSFLGKYILTEDHGQTILSWILYFHVSWYPWEKLASMFYDKQLGPQMEKSLVKLRDELEKPAH